MHHIGSYLHFGQAMFGAISLATPDWSMSIRLVMVLLNICVCPRWRAKLWTKLRPLLALVVLGLGSPPHTLLNYIVMHKFSDRVMTELYI